jgi:hypothetical protein
MFNDVGSVGGSMGGAEGVAVGPIGTDGGIDDTGYMGCTEGDAFTLDGNGGGSVACPAIGCSG